MIPIKDWCSHYAVFFNDAGQFIGKKKIKFKERVFSYDDRDFNFLPDNSSCFIINGFWRKKKYYAYNINEPNPYLLNNCPSPVIDSRVYKSVIENKLIEQLNDLSKGGFLAWLMQPKVLIAILVIGLLLWYFASGQSFLSPKDSVEPVVEGTKTLVRSVP